MQIFFNVSLWLHHQTVKELNSKLVNWSGSPVNNQKSSALQDIMGNSRFIQGIKCNALHHWQNANYLE